MLQEQQKPMRKRGRRSKLTEEDVAQIKAHLQRGKTPAALARHFKVHHITICKIRDMRRWQRVAAATEAIPLSELSKTKRTNMSTPADHMTEDDKWKFAFIPEFADCVARVASVWARLEYDVSVAIWALANVQPALGACITSQMPTLQGRIATLLALGKLRLLDQDIVKRINKFVDDVPGGQEIRNRISHDQWLRDQERPGNMGHMRITAAKKLHFTIQSVPLSELRADLEKLEEFQKRFRKICYEIEEAVATLPDILETTLQPITEVR
jgi:hypothetical protein